MRKRPALYIIIVLLSLSLFSCGGDEICPPPGSTITINPNSVEISDGGPDQNVHTHYFTISVADSDLRPIQDAKLSISYQWAVPDYYSVVQLYDNEERVDSPFNVTTDQNGVYFLRVDFISGAGWSYEGDIEVRACSIFGTAGFAVSGGG